MLLTGISGQAKDRTPRIHIPVGSAKPGEWILDETVWVINDLAESLVRSDPEYAQYRDVLDYRTTFVYRFVVTR